MRRLLFGLVLLLALTVTVGAQYLYLASEAITVSNSAIGFTASKITPSGLPEATTATCVLETAAIRYQIDGSTPTAAVGMPWAVGQTISFGGHQVLTLFKAIRSGGSDGALSCTFSNP